MNGYYIEITNNLLEPKHRKAMKESVWLFMWFLDRMTSIGEDGIGKVLKGKPIKFEDIKKDLGVDERTYRRWVSLLKEGGYIKTTRTPYGLSVLVNKAKKRFGQRDRTKMAYPVRTTLQRDRTDMSPRTYISGTSNIRQDKQDIDKTVDFSKNGNILKGKRELYKKLGWAEPVAK